MADGVVTEADREQRSPESIPEGTPTSAPLSFTSGLNTVTYALIAINVLVYAGMVMSGVSFAGPTLL